jgi:hypothetical protein
MGAEGTDTQTDAASSQSQGSFRVRPGRQAPAAKLRTCLTEEGWMNGRFQVHQFCSGTARALSGRSASRQQPNFRSWRDYDLRLGPHNFSFRGLGGTA